MSLSGYSYNGDLFDECDSLADCAGRSPDMPDALAATLAFINAIAFTMVFGYSLMKLWQLLRNISESHSPQWSSELKAFPIKYTTLTALMGFFGIILFFWKFSIPFEENPSSNLFPLRIGGSQLFNSFFYLISNFFIFSLSFSIKNTVELAVKTNGKPVNGRTQGFVGDDPANGVPSFLFMILQRIKTIILLVNAFQILLGVILFILPYYRGHMEQKILVGLLIAFSNVAYYILAFSMVSATKQIAENFQVTGEGKSPGNSPRIPAAPQATDDGEGERKSAERDLEKGDGLKRGNAVPPLNVVTPQPVASENPPAPPAHSSGLTTKQVESRQLLQKKFSYASNTVTRMATGNFLINLLCLILFLSYSHLLAPIWVFFHCLYLCSVVLIRLYFIKIPKGKSGAAIRPQK